MYRQSEKNLLNSNISFTCPHNMVNFGQLVTKIGLGVRALQQISIGFASCLRYCSDVAHPRPTKLCIMFGHLLGWYTIYTFFGGLLSRQNFARCKIHFTSKSCVLLYWQHYCTDLKQRALAKQPNFATWYKEWNYGTFADGATYIRQGGHHISILLFMK